MSFKQFIKESKGPDVYRKTGKQIEKMMFAHAVMQLTQGKVSQLPTKKQTEDFPKYQAQIEKLLKQGKIIAGKTQTFYTIDKSKLEDEKFDNTSKEIVGKVF